ncbi:helix-turn-helix domain-containing protein [Sansalvadorimonas sp. 2012CJ34-2]|uniref:Helix-turn-helix domain-containing protein n=1 Tax=Parendozoicomonas callyspongiae TaxID=2942213 RepID=A0ABT0PMX7_9GAMM|nr:helix-turn-helix domain-containing protein [Sansalvadorimonas sp. 2012CJ34-2]MCL6271828.1 helix-turn-helix domain-containing protein [Sansalvadorimonas sp. 2012CJ34-2]
MQIYLLALDGMIATSLTLPLEMLNAARQMQRAARDSRPVSVLSIIGDSRKPIKTTGGLTLLPDRSYRNQPQADIIFVPSFWRNPATLPRRWPEVCDWLARQARQGAHICATGTGVFMLAEAGLLDGRPATTHWFYFDKLQECYPELLVKRHHLITQAGNIYCAGSVNSIADLTIHLIEDRLGRSFARRVEQQFSPEIRRRYSDLFYSFESSAPHPDETIVLVQQWLHDHQQESITMPAVAERFSMSQRTLNRRFREATGMTPLDWLLRLRIESARDLLANSNLEVSDIAQRCGFQAPGYFNRVFRKQMDTTPGQYRTSVRGKLFSP